MKNNKFDHNYILAHININDRIGTLIYILYVTFPVLVSLLMLYDYTNGNKYWSATFVLLNVACSLFAGPACFAIMSCITIHRVSIRLFDFTMFDSSDEDIGLFEEQHPIDKDDPGPLVFPDELFEDNNFALSYSQYNLFVTLSHIFSVLYCSVVIVILLCILFNFGFIHGFCFDVVSSFLAILLAIFSLCKLVFYIIISKKECDYYQHQ